MARQFHRLLAILLLAGWAAPASPADAPTRAWEAYGKLGFRFEPNHGQTDSQVRFLSRGPGYTLFLTPAEVVLSLKPKRPSGRPATLRLKMLGANPAEVVGEAELPGKSHYFTGNDPARWRANVPNYARVRLRAVYPAVDLVYYGGASGESQQLEYDLVVGPGADLRAIRLRFEGARKLRLNKEGDLVLETAAGDILQRRPVTYQESRGSRRLIASRYVLLDRRTAGFQVASYDASQPLVIDPALVYSTYLGRTSRGIAVDASGNAYVTGFTTSIDFPTVNAFQSMNRGESDAFVAKLDPARSALVYSTYLGGRSSDGGRGIAADASGNAYVTGATDSGDFPTANAFQSVPRGRSDAFVTKLSPTGSALVYSTYLGGGGDDNGASVAVDASGNAYVTGETGSIDFPTFNAFQSMLRGLDAFVTKLNPTGSALLYSTYLGGGRGEIGAGVALDASGNAYVTGITGSIDFPTVNAFQGMLRGNFDAFLSKLDSSGSALLYSTYLGGGGNDTGAGVAVDASGNAYVTGSTLSADFPAVNAFQSVLRGLADAFVTRLDPAGSALAYSTYLGGAGDDDGRSITVDASGNAYITGLTRSVEFPTENPFQTVFGGVSDAFVIKLNAAGAAVYSTYLGGRGQDEGAGIAVDAAENAYLTGLAGSNFPRASPLPPSILAGAFVAKISPTGRGCVYRLSPYDAVQESGTGTGTLQVRAPSGCEWAAASNADWITITSGRTGQGDGALSYSVAANPGDSSRTGTLMIAGEVCTVRQQTAPAIRAAVNGASFEPGVGPGAIISISGSNLATFSESAATVPLPRQLADRRVVMDGIDAPLFYVSPGQINAQAPFELEGKNTVSLQVLGAASPASPVTVALRPAAPAIFLDYELDGAPTIFPNPAVRNAPISIFCTGLGPVTPPVASGTAAPASPLSRTTQTPTVRIGGIAATVLYSGLAPGFAGLYQVNVLVPAEAPAGSADVVMEAGGASSPPVPILLR